MLNLKIDPKSLQETIQVTTIRDFDGGLNVVDNDLNLDSRYSVVLQNMYRGPDGTTQVRPGTRLFSDIFTFIDVIIGVEYYNNNLICVGQNGNVVAVDGTGASLLIFDEIIAQSQIGMPHKWDAPVAFCSFAEYNGELVICNGVNKPLIVHNTLICEYLIDLATNSNIFVPIARHVGVSGQYLVMSGDPSQPSVLYVSNTNTSGTWAGAPPPNDAVNVDLGSRVVRGSSAIRGHITFRNRLVVLFDECILLGTLGIYNGTVHTPIFDDAIVQYGTLSHNSVRAVGDDVLFVDNAGIPSLTRALYTGDLVPTRPGALIDPLVRAYISGLGQESVQDRIWAVYNIREQQYLVFVPNGDTLADTTETLCFSYVLSKSLNVKAWAQFKGWNFRCGCRSALGRVFMCVGSQIYVLGDLADPIVADYVADQDTYSDGTVHTDGTGWTVPTDLTLYGSPTDTGVPIRFDWQLPWADFAKRMSSKLTRYVSLDTKGDGSFTLDMFVDNIVLDRSDVGESFSDLTLFSDGFGWTPNSDIPYLPALTMDFVGGDFGGYGADGFGVEYGGGRPTSYERLYAWGTKCKIAKFRVHGETKRSLRIVSISLAYQRASMRR